MQLVVILVWTFTVYFPEKKITVSALGNTEIDTFPLFNMLLSES